MAHVDSSLPDFNHHAPLFLTDDVLRTLYSGDSVQNDKLQWVE